MNVVIDTNIFISILIGKSFSNFHKYILSGKVQIITCNEQLFEILDVIQRPKFSKYFSENDSTELLAIIKSISTFVEIRNSIHDCRDEKDNFILEMAINGSANIIVTGDSDLLVLNPYRGIDIVTYKEWGKMIFGE